MSGTPGVMEADGQEGLDDREPAASRAVGNGHDTGGIPPPRVAEALA